MTPDPDEMARLTDEIREKYPRYWHDEQAWAELKALWGEVINANGVFFDVPDEVLYDRSGYKAVIRIGASNGFFAFGCGYSTPTQGYGGSPSIWEELFASFAEARVAAIEFLLGRLPSRFFPHEEGQRGGVEQMRSAVAAHLRQTSLF